MSFDPNEAEALFKSKWFATSYVIISLLRLNRIVLMTLDDITNKAGEEMKKKKTSFLAIC